MKDFKKYFTLPAEPELVYRALTHAPTLQLWTGEPADMTEEEGTEFSLWSGSICGRNLSFRPGKEIVQEWYFGEQEPLSIVTIRLHAIDKGTSVELRHRNIPDEAYDDIVSGWTGIYFGALQDFYRS